MKIHAKIFLFTYWICDGQRPQLCSTKNEYIEESNGNKYVIMLSIDENKDTLNKFGELQNNTWDLIRSRTNNSNDCDEKHIKIILNENNDLPLKKKLELYNIVIVVGPVFHEGTKYYPQVFLDKSLHKL